MKNFKKKWLISASSGIFGKILPIIFGIGIGIVGKQFFSVSIDSDITKGVMGIAAFVIALVAIFFTVLICVEFPLILEWFAYRRESENEKIQLENENLQLENENLKLKSELQEKKSQRDNDE